jgi:ferredoxin
MPAGADAPPHPGGRTSGEGGVSSYLDLDPIACAGHGLCAELFPEWIELDDWGYPIVDRGPIPDELLVHARRAAAGCPKLALTLRLQGERVNAR